MSEPLLRLDGVTLRAADGRAVFESLDWVLPRGARVRIAGEPGSGGSAFLRLLVGLAHPDRGQVFLDGVPHDPHLFHHPFLASGSVAWVPLDGGLQANLSVLENVALPLRFVRRMSQEAAQRLAMQWIDKLGMESLLEVRPHGLEPRERQFAALARSLSMECSLWLLDRPLDALDAPALARAREAMEWILRRPDTTLVMVGEGRRYEAIGLEVWQIAEGRLVREEKA